MASNDFTVDTRDLERLSVDRHAVDATARRRNRIGDPPVDQPGRANSRAEREAGAPLRTLGSAARPLAEQEGVCVVHEGEVAAQPPQQRDLVRESAVYCMLRFFGKGRIYSDTNGMLR